MHWYDLNFFSILFFSLISLFKNLLQNKYTLLPRIYGLFCYQNLELGSFFVSGGEFSFHHFLIKYILRKIKQIYDL
jgi:hypothetical protein